MLVEQLGAVGVELLLEDRLVGLVEHGGPAAVVVAAGGEEGSTREQADDDGSGAPHRTSSSAYMPCTMCGGPSPTSGGPSEVWAAVRYSSGSTPVGIMQMRA